MNATIWLYLWDAHDEGIERSLDTIQAAGLQSISVATSYHTGRFIHPHNPRRKVVFPEEGTIYFRPDLSLYKRIKPKVNSLVESADPMPKLAAEAKKRGLGMVSWTVLLHNHLFGTLYPDCTIQNAFGDRYINSLCPACPDTREYIIALCKNIASLGYFDILQLESFDYMDLGMGYIHEKIGLVVPPLEYALLGTCFCSHCEKFAQAAGVDFQQVRTYTRTTLQNLFDGKSQPNPEPWRKVLSSVLHGEFEKFIGARKKVVTSFVEEIRGAIKPYGTKLQPMVWASPSILDFYGADLKSLSKIADEFIVLGYPPDLVEFETFLDSYLQALSPSKPVLGFSAIHPTTRDILLGKFQISKKKGVNRFSIYNYGLMPLQNLSWVREALSGQRV